MGTVSEELQAVFPLSGLRFVERFVICLCWHLHTETGMDAGGVDMQLDVSCISVAGGRMANVTLLNWPMCWRLVCAGTSGENPAPTDKGTQFIAFQLIQSLL